MPHNTLVRARAGAGGFMLLVLCTSGAHVVASSARSAGAQSADPVLARVYEHLGQRPRPLVQVVDSSHFPPEVWSRVKHLVAFRLHRQVESGTTAVDAATYLVRDSSLYVKAAAVLRNATTNHEYVWCLLTAVLAHEAAHTAPGTERQALTAEAVQLRFCLRAGHLPAGGGWSGLAYLREVEARMRRPREHY